MVDNQKIATMSDSQERRRSQIRAWLASVDDLDATFAALDLDGDGAISFQDLLKAGEDSSLQRIGLTLGSLHSSVFGARNCWHCSIYNLLARGSTI